MTLEEMLFSVLSPLVEERVFPDVAPLDTPKPYVTYQLNGGPDIRWLNGTAPDKRRSLVQINTWGANRLQVNNLMRAIEDAMCATTVFAARPEGELKGSHEPDAAMDDAPQGLFGAIQDFNVISTR